MKCVLAVCIALISVVPSRALWWSRNHEAYTYHACGLTLDLMVSEVCADSWQTRCDTPCRKKRDAEGQIQTFEEEQKAKAFLVHRSRREVWSLNEECCNEGCRVEEVHEHC
ncbi:hypothetical protein CAPTEDRAFT_219147 [Capitella teleta]|uniref:Insulin-like domain-containing protein n=1 Tax=Capitella teleta TaxID=283909 RepID=R7TXL4_CAPTE|nr:hypothetical protein CAPTEDRAFT_219147 [Capitella teleta]|eukprot:ELT98673.1 hypothetical protein CAPTEDRAFT_219147 [Capitella teleta]